MTLRNPDYISLRFALIMSCVFGFFSCDVLAVGCLDFTAQDVAAMPSYCQARCSVPKDHPLNINWKRKMGQKNWIHLHHYCFAIGFTNRLTKTHDKRQRQFLMERIRANFGYVLQRWPKKFRLLPEAHLRFARAQESGGDMVGAAKNYQAAINAQPRRAAGYAAFSDFLRRSGDANGANEILQQGLRINPNSKALRARAGN